MNYVRDHAAVKATLVESEFAIITKTGCQIVFPERFVKIGLAELSVVTYVYGIYALVLPDGIYSVCNINAMMRVMPDRVEKIKFTDGMYYQLTFNPASVVIASTKLVKNESLIYQVFNELIFHGKIPWYFTYADLGKLFDTSDKHAGSNVNSNLAVIELMISILARDPKDHNRLFRLIASDVNDVPDFIALDNVYYATAGTLNKIAGNRFSKGVVSALVQPNEDISKIEEILRA